MEKTLIPTLLLLSNIALADGQEIYRSVCYSCHDYGINFAPKFGAKNQWTSRSSKDIEELVDFVVTGKGNMPPNAGSNLTEFEIREAVFYMIKSLK